jgi:hypothetical protein
MEMATQHYGVFCAQCGEFIPLGQYETLTPEKIGSDVDLGHSAIGCPGCHTAVVYANAEVKHLGTVDFISKVDAGRLRDRMAVLCPAYDWSVASFEQQTPKAVEIKYRLVARRIER